MNCRPPYCVFGKSGIGSLQKPSYCKQKHPPEQGVFLFGADRLIHPKYILCLWGPRYELPTPSLPRINTKNAGMCSLQEQSFVPIYYINRKMRLIILKIVNGYTFSEILCSQVQPMQPNQAVLGRTRQSFKPSFMDGIDVFTQIIRKHKDFIQRNSQEIDFFIVSIIICGYFDPSHIISFGRFVNI